MSEELDLEKDTDSDEDQNLFQWMKGEQASN
jgi:hypothetical protein